MRKNNMWIMILVVFVIGYSYRVYYVNFDTNSLREYKEVHLNEWFSSYGGEMKIKNISIYNREGEKYLKVEMDLKDVENGSLFGNIVFDGYVVNEAMIGNYDTFIGFEINLEKKELSSDDILVITNSKVDPYEKYMFKLLEAI